MILGIATLWYPDYELKHWQQWLIYVALIWFAVALNIFGSAIIPKFNQMICTPLETSSYQKTNPTQSFCLY